MRPHFVRTLVFAACLALWPGLGATQTDATPLSRYTQNNLIHIILHETGHALIREFDLPILTYEEAMADDFATLLILSERPDDAPDILRDRIRSHLGDGDEPRIFSDYLHDAQRAGRMVCLAYGSDPGRFIGLAEDFGMEIAEEGSDCIDLTSEVARAWRRTIAPLRLPDGAPVTEFALRGDVDADLSARLQASFFGPVVVDLLASFDWHSLITLRFDDCDGGAYWRRNGRQIIVCSAYIERLEAEAEALAEDGD